jgi:hypothetical protein
MQPTCAMRTAMSIEAAACAVAARVMGYPAFSEVILEQQLSPRAVAAMLRMSATKDGTAAAIIILTAGTARHAADPNGWGGETERLLALDAVTPTPPASSRLHYALLRSSRSIGRKLRLRGLARFRKKMASSKLAVLG